MAGIESLLDQSLLQLDAARLGVADVEPRFTMLETIRDYAREVLEAGEEMEVLRSRHAAYYLELAETIAPALIGHKQPVWLTRLNAEQDNLRAALAWMLEQNEIEAGLRLGVALHRSWLMQGALSEGRQWLEMLLAHTEQVAISDLVHAHALFVAGDLARCSMMSRR